MSMTPTCTVEHGTVVLMAPIAWREGTFRERRVTFSAANLPFLVAAARAFVSFVPGVNGEATDDGDVLTTQLGGTDAHPILIVQNTRNGEEAGTVWLNEAQTREILEILASHESAEA